MTLRTIAVESTGCRQGRRRGLGRWGASEEFRGAVVGGNLGFLSITGRFMGRGVRKSLRSLRDRILFFTYRGYRPRGLGLVPLLRGWQAFGLRGGDGSRDSMGWFDAAVSLADLRFAGMMKRHRGSTQAHPFESAALPTLRGWQASRAGDEGASGFDGLTRFEGAAFPTNPACWGRMRETGRRA